MASTQPPPPARVVGAAGDLGVLHPIPYNVYPHPPQLCAGRTKIIHSAAEVLKLVKQITRFFRNFNFVRFSFVRRYTYNRDDRVSPARLSVGRGQLLCAGCGLGDHLILNLSFGIAFPFNPLQTYMNSSLYLPVLGLKAARPLFPNLGSL